MQIRHRNLRNYTTVEGREPFRDWITQLRDKKAQAIIAQRIERLRLGNPGDYKRIKWILKNNLPDVQQVLTIPCMNCSRIQKLLIII